MISAVTLRLWRMHIRCKDASSSSPTTLAPRPQTGLLLMTPLNLIIRTGENRTLSQRKVSLRLGVPVKRMG
jgi:hypothetical protein